MKCYHYQEVGLPKKFCPKRNKKVKDEESRGEVSIVEDGYESANILIVSTCESDQKWILDSGCTFHMTPNKDWFESFQEVK